jgi:hypothetical protein
MDPIAWEDSIEVYCTNFESSFAEVGLAPPNWRLGRSTPRLGTMHAPTEGRSPSPWVALTAPVLYGFSLCSPGVGGGKARNTGNMSGLQHRFCIPSVMDGNDWRLLSKPKVGRRANYVHGQRQ